MMPERAAPVRIIGRGRPRLAQVDGSTVIDLMFAPGEPSEGWLLSQPGMITAAALNVDITSDLQ